MSLGIYSLADESVVQDVRSMNWAQQWDVLPAPVTITGYLEQHEEK